MSPAKAKLSEDNIIRTPCAKCAWRCLRLTLALPVVRTSSIRSKIARSVPRCRKPDPAAAFVKIVRELEELMGAANEDLALNAVPPAVVLMAGLQGAG